MKYLAFGYMEVRALGSTTWKNVEVCKLSDRKSEIEDWIKDTLKKQNGAYYGMDCRSVSLYYVEIPAAERVYLPPPTILKEPVCF